MASLDDQSELTAETPIGKFRARGADLISLMLAAWLGLLTYGLYMHMTDAEKSAAKISDATKEVARTLADTNKEMVKAIQEGNKAQRLSTCIQATKEDQKESEYMRPNSFCNRMVQ